MAGEMEKTRIEEFIRFCRERHLNVTHQRLAIYQALLNSTEHPTAEDIFRTIQSDYPTISRATVYKTLELFEREGIIRKVSFPHETAARYDANPQRHHHLFCVQCHRVEDLSHPQLDALPLSKRALNNYQVIDHVVHINGICPACQQKRRS